MEADLQEFLVPGVTAAGHFNPALSAEKDSPYRASRAGSATATRWVQGGRPLPLSASWSKSNPGELNAGSPLRLASYFPPALSFSPSGAPPPPPRDWPRDPATGSTRRGDSRSTGDPGFPKLGLGRAGSSPPAARRSRMGPARRRMPGCAGCPRVGHQGWGGTCKEGLSPAAGWTQDQILRAGTAPLPT